MDNTFIDSYMRENNWIILHITFLLSTRMGLHPLLLKDVKVYYSQREYIVLLNQYVFISSRNALIKMF